MLTLLLLTCFPSQIEPRDWRAVGSFTVSTQTNLIMTPMPISIHHASDAIA